MLVEPFAGPVFVLRQGQRDRAGRMAQTSSLEAVVLDVGVVGETEYLPLPLGALIEVGDGEAQVVVTGNAGHVSLLPLWSVRSGDWLQPADLCDQAFFLQVLQHGLAIDPPDLLDPGPR